MVAVEVIPEKPLSPSERGPMLGVAWDAGGDIDVRIVHPNPFVQVADSLKMMWVTIAVERKPWVF